MTISHSNQNSAPPSQNNATPQNAVGNSASTDNSNTTHPSSTDASPQPPPQSGDLIRPYALIKDPYKDKGEMATLAPRAIPVLVGDTPIEFESLPLQTAKLSGMKGLQFDKMISPQIALFNVMAVDSRDPDGPQMEGQLAVVLVSRSTPPDDTRPWDIEPLGTVEGTNGFGAKLDIPAVRFWGYHKSEATSTPNNRLTLSGNSLKAVNLVRKHIQPTSALLALGPDLKNAQWQPVNDDTLCKGCWYVSAHIRIRTNSTDPVQYFANPGWEVDLEKGTIKPDADAKKFFEINDATPASFTQTGSGQR